MHLLDRAALELDLVPPLLQGEEERAEDEQASSLDRSLVDRLMTKPPVVAMERPLLPVFPSQAATNRWGLRSVAGTTTGSVRARSRAIAVCESASSFGGSGRGGGAAAVGSGRW